jgi:2-methylcitrate dehydratase
MTVRENPQFTKDYFEPDKRYIGNSIELFFKDGSRSEKISIDYPIGHRKRRAEGIPVLLRKFDAALRGYLPNGQAGRIVQACQDARALEAMPLQDFMGLLAI